MLAYTNILYILKQHLGNLIKLILYFLFELLEAIWILCFYRDKVSFQLLYALSYKNSKQSSATASSLPEIFVQNLLFTKTFTLFTSCSFSLCKH